MDKASRAQYLQALQIPEWTLRKAIVPVVAETVSDAVVVNDQEHIDLKKPLVESKLEPELDALLVNEKPDSFQLQGSGSPNADCLLLGNVAVVDEEESAFADNEKILLANMLKAIGLSLEDVFTVRPLACLATLMRDPQELEAKQCQDYIMQHINKIQPKAVLIMNQLVAEILLDTQQTILQLSGKVHTLSSSSVQVIATYPPAHLLKKPADKRKAWEDLKLLKQVLV